MMTLRRLRLLLVHDKALLALIPETLWRLMLARIQLLFPFAGTAPQQGEISGDSRSIQTFRYSTHPADYQGDPGNESLYSLEKHLYGPGGSRPEDAGEAGD